MKIRWRMPHPATMFFLLTLVVVFFSWICDIYGLTVKLPQTGEEIHVQSLLSAEGIRWWLRNAISNFTGFTPLGMVIIALFGLGVAQHSGLIDAFIRLCVHSRSQKNKVIFWVIFLGLISNVVGDAGYVILIPIAAALFSFVGLNPLAGIITAYVAVSGGYSANILLGTIDPILAQYTQEALPAMSRFGGDVGPLCNYFFMFVSTFVVGFVIYVVTKRYLIPSLPQDACEIKSLVYKPLSRREREALFVSLIALLIYVAIILWFTFSSQGIFRGINGGLLHSPLIDGLLFLISFGIGIVGMVYGFASRRYRTDKEVIDGLISPINLMGVYIVIVFFAAQMFACLNYSHLDKCLMIGGANMLLSFQPGGLSMLLLFILFTAVVNLIMVSATGKWSVMAYIFIPVFAQLGLAPDIVQCAYRIGDSATNIITPFMLYMPVILTYMHYYDKHVTFGSLFKYTWKYALAIFVVWTLLFVLWYALALPFGK